MRAVRSGPRRADRPAPPDRLRCAPALRARHRSRADAGCGRSCHRDGAGTLRRRARRGHRGRRASGLAAHRDAAVRAHRRSRRLRHSGRRGGRLAATPGLRGADAATRRASRSRCRRGATTSRRRSSWTRRATLDPAVAAKAAEGCAEIEPECDLVEEVLRLRGLDAVPPVSLPRASPVPLADADAEAGPHRARPAHAGGAGPGRVRHLQLHGAGRRRRCSATRRRRCA